MPHGDSAQLLARGVDAGVISAEQRDALLALGIAPGPVEESSRALDGVTIAYGLGAALVVFALGWFLADRWELLGAGGVLAVAAGYALLFGLVAAKLARERFPLAAGVALALVVCTAPIVSWALLRLTGEWPAETTALARYEPFAATRRLVVAFGTVLAALLAVRFAPQGPVRRTPVAIPLAAAAGFALIDLALLLTVAVAGIDFRWETRGWAQLAAGAALFGAAYTVDQRAPADERREDFAAWLYAAACVAAQVGLVEAFDGTGRHAIAAIALVQLAAASRLQRRPLLIAGVSNVVWYLGYLAFDVFRDVLSFPFLLATFGAALLLMTVIVQRRFPTLLRRNQLGTGARPALPGGMLTAWAPLAVALALLPVYVSHVRHASALAEQLERTRVHAERPRH